MTNKLQILVVGTLIALSSDQLYAATESLEPLTVTPECSKRSVLSETDSKWIYQESDNTLIVCFKLDKGDALCTPYPEKVELIGDK
jgi:hypothetical protein